MSSSAHNKRLEYNWAGICLRQAAHSNVKFYYSVMSGAAISTIIVRWGNIGYWELESNSMYAWIDENKKKSTGY